MSEEAFYYVDGMPTKGMWIDIEAYCTEEDILEQLADGGFILRHDDESPAYDGDLLVADIQGDLTRHFYKSGMDWFDLSGFVECMTDCDRNKIDYAAAGAYISYAGSWSLRDYEDAACGKYDSEVAYAEELFDECYLHEVPESIRCYIDYEKFARDLFMSDYYFDDDTGYVFRSC